ncbi:hypothetical protein [Nocardiopsis algeriensis]|uniref:Uncharacterized protein n=1 Tax=Nocardiopsis algeriensis TaxID=1478215 RepID=A0A841IQE8_9ACTN|nr:hypothetical protein [Nocardiopsis algeriensis]MBB6121069.1 hypothetical protein [Nocardiopsis algeriensis]
MVPVMLGFVFPGVRKFFSEVEEARVQGREGHDTDLEEARSLCLLEGAFALSYVIIINLPGMALYYVLFEVFGMAGGGVYSDLLVLVGLALLATVAVELLDAAKISLPSFAFGGSYVPRLIGPTSYLLIFVFSFLVMCWIFFA